MQDIVSFEEGQDKLKINPINPRAISRRHTSGAHYAAEAHRLYPY